MGIVYKDTHSTEALARLISQFRGKPNLEAILSVVIKQVQDLENVSFELLTERYIDVAEGAQVDGFGAIVGEAREGRGDAEYKIAIKARMQLNLGNGTPEDIIQLIRGIAGDVRVRIYEFYPAAFMAEIVDPIDPLVVDPARILGIVQAGKPAGVWCIVGFGVIGSFRFDAGPGFDIGKYGGALG